VRAILLMGLLGSAVERQAIHYGFRGIGMNKTSEVALLPHQQIERHRRITRLDLRNSKWLDFIRAASSTCEK
jgi:hypothetical protein